MPTTVDIESQRMLLGSTPVRKIYQGTNLLGTRIAELFAGNVPGVWYDPSDLSTLFQDSAGTTPVTAVEQPVGLILDKSKGLTLGALTAAIKYNNATPGKATYTNNPDGSTTCTANLDAIGGYAYNGFSLEVEAGKTYLVRTFSYEPTFRIYYAHTAGQIDFVHVARERVLAGEHVARLTIPSGKNRLLCVTQQAYPFVGSFTTAPSQVREILGNHAYQPTATSRPVLSARVNLLTKTEQFDDAAWAKYAERTAITTVTSNVGVDPHGALTADLVTFVAGGSNLITHNVTVPPGVSMTLSVWMRGTIGGEKIRLDLKNTLSDGVSGQQFTLTTEWVRYSVTVNNDSGISRGFQFRRNFNDGGTSSFYIWGADLRVANDGANLPPYQRVNTATDYDTVGFPHYLRFDGVDDFLDAGTLDFSTATQSAAVIGIRKLSDAVAARPYSHGLSTGQNGAFWFLAPANPGQASVRASSRGADGVLQETVSTNDKAAPIKLVLCSTYGAGAPVSIRYNGMESRVSSGSLGALTLPSARSIIGAQATGATTQSSFFSGRIYGLAHIARALSSVEQRILEQFIRNKSRAY